MTGNEIRDSEVIEIATRAARQLTYNDGREARAKALIYQLASRLDRWDRQPIRRALRLTWRRLWHGA